MYLLVEYVQAEIDIVNLKLAAVLEHYPEIAIAMIERDWDFMSHGLYNTRYLYTYTEEQERDFYRDCIETLKRHTGKDLKGMLGPALSATAPTIRRRGAAAMLALVSSGPPWK